MKRVIETVEYGGWPNNVRIANDEIELVVTKDVGPRVIRFSFVGGQNVLGELEEEMGRSGEGEWKLRGGHRLWVAPEEKPRTYEPDNDPVAVQEIRGGIQTVQTKGPLSGIQKVMQIRLIGPRSVRIRHILTNLADNPVRVAPWALTVMAPRGVAIIPLPARIPHTERLLHNQEWSLWGYTDLSDPRWTIGSRYLLFRQDPARGPNKLGIAHREGWAAYWCGGMLFVKRFERLEGRIYPDGNVNFETFANERFLELESLGPLVRLKPGASTKHEEVWELHRDVPPCACDADVDSHVRPLIR